MTTLNNGFNLGSTLSAYSLTGNPAFDAMIYAHLVPLIISYWSFVTCYIKELLVYLLTYMGNYVNKTYLVTFSGSNIVLCTEVLSSNTLIYHFMMDNIILNNDVRSDKNSTQFMDSVKQFMEKKDKKTNNYWDSCSWNTPVKWNTEYDLSMTNVSSSDTDRIVYNKSYKSHELNEDICKTFVFENLVIKMALVGKHTSDSRVDITVYQMDLNKEPFQLNMFEIFLKKRFNFLSHIPIVQTINIRSKCIAGQLDKFVGRNMQDPSLSILSCGDGKYDNHIDKTVTKTSENNYSYVHVTSKNKFNIVFDESIEDYTNKMVFEGHNMSNLQSTDSFINLYEKYIESTTTNISSNKNYATFYHNNRIIIIYNDKRTGYTIKIVSHNDILSLTEIQTFINDMLTNRLINCKKTIPTKTIKVPIDIYKRVDGQWKIYELDIRGFDTIYLPDKLMKEITYEFEKFAEMKTLYKLYQIPHRKGILFYGPPGTGKTSLIKALAYEHQMNIYVINVNDSDVNDDTISNILSSIGKSGSKILLFEDIDSAFSDKENVKHTTKKVCDDNDDIKTSQQKLFNVSPQDDNSKQTNSSETVSNNIERIDLSLDNLSDLSKYSSSKSHSDDNKFLTYSGLLNALDGVLSGHEGVITVMTTNYIDKLGTAFLRPGRIDRKFHLSHCNDEQLYQMLHNFVKQRLALMETAIKKLKTQNSFDTEYLEQNKKYLDWDLLDTHIREFIHIIKTSNDKYTPAQMQQYLIRNIENIDNIFNNVHCIKESYDCSL
jgi:ATP-dependent 26S proteasome regulatory subunit